jgi:uncharacterized protein YkwD
LNIFLKPKVFSRNEAFRPCLPAGRHWAGLAGHLLVKSKVKAFLLPFYPSHPLLNRKRRRFGIIKMFSKTSLMIFLILLLSFTVGFPQSIVSEDAKFLSPLENSVVREINMARTAPKDYASLLEQSKKYYDKKILRLPGKTPILTKEGVKSVNEAIRFLHSLQPLPPLIPSKGMSLGARDHVKDQASSGSGQHKGSDGSQPLDRVNRYGTWEKSIGENISYGSDQARDIVMGLIIDDGVPGRGHRKNIFHSDFRVIGVACGPHPAYRTVCVMTFAGGYKEKSVK